MGIPNWLLHDNHQVHINDGILLSSVVQILQPRVVSAGTAVRRSR